MEFTKGLIETACLPFAHVVKWSFFKLKWFDHLYNSKDIYQEEQWCLLPVCKA